MAKVLVAGASGGVGKAVIRELNQQQHHIRALVRNQAKLEQQTVNEVFVADARDLARLKGACDNIEVVISALGGSLQLGRTKDKATYWDVDYQANKNLLVEAQQAGVRKFIYVSVFQAEQMKGLAYGEAHAAFEAELKHSGLDYALIRPTGIFYIFEEFLKLARKGVVPLIGAGDVQTNPIDETDVAKVCVEAIGAAPKVIDLGGPKIFSRRELAELCFKRLGKPSTLHQIPRRADAPVNRAREALRSAVVRLARLWHSRQFH